MKFELTAKRLKIALERKNWIAQDLADNAGISKSSIN